MAHFVDFGLDISDFLYIGTAENPKAMKYTGSNIPKLRVVSAVGESLHFELETDANYDFGDNIRGFVLSFSDYIAEGMFIPVKDNT